MDAYSQLLERLEQFIRRYYKNQLIKGALYSIAYLGTYFIAVNVLVYFGHFNEAVRAVLFFGTLAFFIYILGRFVGRPIAGLLKLGKRLSHRGAAEIIGAHFADVEDRLINILELRDQAAQNELALASVAQKAESMRLIPFQTAIDFRSNRTYLRYALAPITVFALLWFTGNRAIFTEGTPQLIAYQKPFVPEAPFHFIAPASWEVLQGSDVEIAVELEGDVLPAEVQLHLGDVSLPMQDRGEGRFTYLIRKVQASQSLYFEGGGFRSDVSQLEVLPKPTLQGFEIELDYPAYTGRTDEVQSATGDLVIPAGTSVRWVFQSRHTDEIIWRGIPEPIHRLRTANGSAALELRFTESMSYVLKTLNDRVQNPDSSFYSIRVIPDAYPVIEVEKSTDSIRVDQLYFRGEARDDYGLTRLELAYRTAPDQPFERELINLNTTRGRGDFFHFWDLESLELEPGAHLEYFFEVWDNDGVRGPKSSRTPLSSYRLPTREALREEADASARATESQMTATLEMARDIQQKIKALQQKMRTGEPMSWEDRRQLEDLLKMQQQLQQQVQQLNEQNKQSNLRKEQLGEEAQRILEKQRQLEQLMDQMMTDEMKELMKEMQEMLESLDTEEMRERLDQLEKSNENLERELDRNLELFKQMELEQKLENAQRDLESLKKEQEELRKEVENGQKSPEEASDAQEKLEEKLEELQKDLEEMREKNRELESPHSMPDTQDLEKEIGDKMDEASEELQRGKPQKGAQKQQQAEEKMDELGDKLDQMQQSMSMESQSENMEDLRQLLDNLVILSLDQEDLMVAFEGTDAQDPRFVDLTRNQYELADLADHIGDSLFALSKRVMQIEPIITREMAAISGHMEQTVALLAERKKSNALSRQQFVMTSANNLALLLSEALEQMQQQMASMMQGQQSCQKPGSGKPSMSEMMKMQQQMLNEMEQMKGQKPGSKPGDKNDGKGKPGGKMSEEFGRMAAKQAALREQLRKMAEEMGEGGSAPGGLGDALQKMEEVERDVLNKDITEETLKRQQEILTRLLEAEQAERERERDNKRESRTGDDSLERANRAYEAYQRMKSKEADLLRSVPPGLTPFYKNLADEYFRRVVTPDSQP